MRLYAWVAVIGQAVILATITAGSTALAAWI
jgi:hypothetical protein